jgi:hypothetical protein
MTLQDAARGRAIASGLAGAIERAAEDLAALGLDSDEAGEFITDVFVGCDWASCFEGEDE